MALSGMLYFTNRGHFCVPCSVLPNFEAVKRASNYFLRNIFKIIFYYNLQYEYLLWYYESRWPRAWHNKLSAISCLIPPNSPQWRCGRRSYVTATPRCTARSLRYHVKQQLVLHYANSTTHTHDVVVKNLLKDIMNVSVTIYCDKKIHCSARIDETDMRHAQKFCIIPYH